MTTKSVSRNAATPATEERPDNEVRCAVASLREEAFGADYFERGFELGLSWYSNYRWMPARSHAEAEAFLEAMGHWPLAERPEARPCVVDYGCAKGFFVRALQEKGVHACGVDLSEYALGVAEQCVRYFLYSIDQADEVLAEGEHLTGRPAALGFCKDVLEHCAQGDGPYDLAATLARMARLARRWLVIVPLARGGRYLIPEYELDVTHVLREDERFWFDALGRAGFTLERASYSVPGLKDKWVQQRPNGNLFLKVSC
jgi:SAM-dependent methyltransferase